MLGERVVDASMLLVLAAPEHALPPFSWPPVGRRRYPRGQGRRARDLASITQVPILAPIRWLPLAPAGQDIAKSSGVSRSSGQQRNRKLLLGSAHHPRPMADSPGGQGEQPVHPQRLSQRPQRSPVASFPVGLHPVGQVVQRYHLEARLFELPPVAARGLQLRDGPESAERV